MKDILSAIVDAVTLLAVVYMWESTRKMRDEMREMMNGEDDDEPDDGEGDNPQDKGPKTPFGIDRDDPGDWWK